MQDIDTSTLSLEEKLVVLNELVVDSLIEGIQEGKIKPIELQGAITMLKNNKILIEDKNTEMDEYMKLRGSIK